MDVIVRKGVERGRKGVDMKGGLRWLVEQGQEIGGWKEVQCTTFPPLNLMALIYPALILRRGLNSDQKVPTLVYLHP